LESVFIPLQIKKIR